MDDQKRRIFLSQREVFEAGNPPVIGVRAEVQTVRASGASSTETVMAYVELDAAEREWLLSQRQDAINAFGMRFGPVVAQRLAGDFKEWRDAPHAGLN